MPDIRSPRAKRGSASTPVLIAGMAVIVALLGVIVFLLLGRGNDAPPPEPAAQESATQQRAVVVNEDNAEQVAEEIIEEPSVPAGYYEVNMNFTWDFPDGESESTNAYVENNVTNTNSVYFDVVLAEDESVVLYESPVLPTGTHINNIKLNRDLEAGSYPCVIIYHLVDGQQETISTVRMTLDIVVNS